MKPALPTVVLAALALAGCPSAHEAGDRAAPAQTLTIKGSDTMVHLVTAWAEAYMQAHPEAQISVTGGGSGTGIAAMINGTTEVCMASRALKPEELELARRRGVAPIEYVVGRDGLAVVVHPANAVDALTLDQLRQVFNGTLTRWKQVGGADVAIQVLSRESNSGTYVFFNEQVLRKDDYAARARLLPSTAAVIHSTAQDSGSIGYVGLGYVQGAAVKVVGVKADADAPAVAASVEAVREGSYPIARPLLLYTQGEPAGLAKAFLDFCSSPAGQEIVAETGYIPVGLEATE